MPISNDTLLRELKGYLTADEAFRLDLALAGTPHKMGMLIQLLMDGVSAYERWTAR